MTALKSLPSSAEIVKLAPAIRKLQRTDELDFSLVHTGQHYDDELSGTFFETLSLPSPDVSPSVGSGDHSQQTADALAALGDIFRSRDPDVVLAQGGTNTVLSTALATSKHCSVQSRRGRTWSTSRCRARARVRRAVPTLTPSRRPADTGASVRLPATSPDV